MNNPSSNQKARSNKALDYTFEIVGEHGNNLMQIQIFVSDSVAIVTYIPVTDLMIEIMRYYNDGFKQFAEKRETIEDEH
jgi:hypothetical protein